MPSLTRAPDGSANVTMVRPITGLGAAARSSIDRGRLSGVEATGSPLTTTSMVAAGPQLPAESCARTWILRVPGGKMPVVSAPLIATLGEPKAPDIDVPVPAGAGLVPWLHSAAAMFEPPRTTSLAVAETLAAVWLL